MRIRDLLPCVSLAALVAATASCGDVVRSSRGPVMLQVNALTAGGNAGTLMSDVVKSSAPPCPCTTSITNDTAQATLAIVQKDFTAPTSANNRVTINRYHVEYRRADGRNTPGVDVPFPFDGAVTISIEPGGTSTVGFEIVRHVAKEEAPLVQLVNSANVISTITNVTFYGKDQVRNDMSATGSLLVDFGNFADQ